MSDWNEKLSKWRTSSEKHWSWRKNVEKFLRNKVAETEKDS